MAQSKTQASLRFQDLNLLLWLATLTQATINNYFSRWQQPVQLEQGQSSLGILCLLLMRHRQAQVSTDAEFTQSKATALLIKDTQLK